ncbi:TPM domain-containing protein [Caulobacter henricii]|uniref:Methanol dehydrogenase n=1 Tax=Caulobacter henricii TaxID=69395 RepID=A0A0P0P2I3_9CAUL|nr:TPM domain-containing protein [Caulobacter henricii]ALL14775.1 methanol dehydrogenase [Caulobacter henricii]
MLCLSLALPAVAAPKFPPLSGRVVDEANILSPQVEQDLTVRLKTLEDTTGRQLVVATVPSLQGYEIEDYGYQLGRSWGLGDKTRDDGVILLVAPTEKKVRIEVGYGLEPVLTDALSSVIIQSAILPKFKAGDLPGGIVAGADELVTQLSLPEDQAKAKVAQAAEPQASSPGSGFSPIAALLIGLFVFFLITRLLPGRRGRRSGLGAALPWIILDALTSGNGRGGGGGFGGGGGGGFSGGGGSFGGGGSSGSW